MMKEYIFIMKKKIALVSIAVLILLSYGVYKAFFDTNLSNLDGRGTLIREVVNPFNSNIKARVFTIDDGGATVRPSLRVAANSNEGSFEDTTVFWYYPLSEMDSTTIEWIDESSFEINQIVIDINDKTTWFNWKEAN